MAGLVEFVSEARQTILNDLSLRRPPSLGAFDASLWQEVLAKTSAQPQVGALTHKPRSIVLEFVYSDPQTRAIVLPVEVETPERIVHMPVPDWVVESIWQGEISGSFRFESEAREMVRHFEAMLSEGENERWFGPQPPKRRE